MLRSCHAIMTLTSDMSTNFFPQFVVMNLCPAWSNAFCSAMLGVLLLRLEGIIHSSPALAPCNWPSTESLCQDRVVADIDENLSGVSGLLLCMDFQGSNSQTCNTCATPLATVDMFPPDTIPNPTQKTQIQPPWVVHDGGDSDCCGGERGSGFVLWRKTCGRCACRHGGLGFDVPIPQGSRRETNRLGRTNTALVPFRGVSLDADVYFSSRSSAAGFGCHGLCLLCVAVFHTNTEVARSAFSVPPQTPSYLAETRTGRLCMACYLTLPPCDHGCWEHGPTPLLLHVFAASSTSYTHLMRCKQTRKGPFQARAQQGRCTIASSHVDHFVASDAGTLSKCAGGHGLTEVVEFPGVHRAYHL